MELEHTDGLRQRVEVGHARLEPLVQLGRQLVVKGVERRAMPPAERACVPAIWMSARKGFKKLTLVDGVVAQNVPARGHVPPPVAIVVSVVRRQAAISTMSRADQGAPESTRHEFQEAELRVWLSGLRRCIRFARWQTERSGHGGAQWNSGEGSRVARHRAGRVRER